MFIYIYLFTPNHPGKKKPKLLPNGMGSEIKHFVDTKIMHLVFSKLHMAVEKKIFNMFIILPYWPALGPDPQT